VAEPINALNITAQEVLGLGGAKQRLHFIETPKQSISYKSQAFNPVEESKI
jgi:hypothetical protein